MFEKIYLFLKDHIGWVESFHNLLAQRIDKTLGAFFYEKIGCFGTQVSKFLDKLMTFIIAVVAISAISTVAYQISSFLWIGYRETHVGEAFTRGNSQSSLVAHDFFTAFDMVDIIFTSFYGAIIMLVLFSLTRLFFINRYCYENRPWLLTSLVWGVPLAKVISSYYFDGMLVTMPLMTAEFMLLLLPTVIIVHPAMDLVNWAVPEIDDLCKAPFVQWRRLRVEQKIAEVKQKKGK